MFSWLSKDVAGYGWRTREDAAEPTNSQCNSSNADSEEYTWDRNCEDKLEEDIPSPTPILEHSPNGFSETSIGHSKKAVPIIPIPQTSVPIIPMATPRPVVFQHTRSLPMPKQNPDGYLHVGSTISEPLPLARCNGFDVAESIAEDETEHVPKEVICWKKMWKEETWTKAGKTENMQDPDEGGEYRYHWDATQELDTLDENEPPSPADSEFGLSDRQLEMEAMLDTQTPPKIELSLGQVAKLQQELEYWRECAGNVGSQLQRLSKVTATKKHALLCLSRAFTAWHHHLVFLSSLNTDVSESMTPRRRQPQRQPQRQPRQELSLSPKLDAASSTCADTCS